MKLYSTVNKFKEFGQNMLQYKKLYSKQTNKKKTIQGI